MPRVYDSSNDPIDYCRRHFPKTEEKALELHNNAGDGPDGRGNCFSYESDHPPYEDCDYKCYNCGRLLTEADN